MTVTKVLIVDDSKTAQIKLKRLLGKYEIKIDTAYSAEEAISFLSYNHPDLIFLDHHMRGMDGLVALKTIKENPKTALIPVIMYTSEQGSVYVGQARALGAIDILTKGAIQPSNLERILKNLHIYPASDEGVARAAVDQAAKEERIDIENVLEGNNTGKPRIEFQAERMEVKNQMSRLFEFHSETMRRRLDASTEMTVRQLTTLTERLINQKVNENITSTTENYYAIDNAHATIKGLESKLGTSLIAVAMLFVLGIGLVSFQFFQLKNAVKNSNETSLALYDSLSVEMMAQTQAQIPSTQSLQTLTTGEISTNDIAGTDRIINAELETVVVIEEVPQNRLESTLADAVAWANQEDLQFDYGQIPLDQTRVDKLDEFLILLGEARFTGTVEVDLNFGNLCLERNNLGDLSLANSELPISDCLMYSDLEPEFLAEDYISVSFQNFRSASQSIQNGEIELKLVSSGLNRPHTDYPRKSDINTAGQWNSVALSNNRIDINLRNKSFAQRN